MKLTNNLRTKFVKLYYLLNSLFQLSKDSFKRDKVAKVSIAKKLNLYLNGFVQNKHVLYDFDKYPMRDYISDYHKRKIYYINHDYRQILFNKRVLKNVLYKFNIMPETYGIILDGRFISSKFQDVESMIKALANKKIVIKPTIGYGGANISVVEFKEDKIYKNFYLISKSEFINMLKSLKDYYIEEFVQQADYINNIYPHSANTIRIVTLIDPINKTPFVAYTSHRIGRDTSKPVDNWSKGGILCAIDLHSGMLSKAKWSDKEEGIIHISEKHPNTNKQIEGVRVPNFQEMKNKIMQISQEMNYLPMIGWDVVITNDSFCIIEANAHPCVSLGQMHHPLRVNKQVERFYQHYKC